MTETMASQLSDHLQHDHLRESIGAMPAPLQELEAICAEIYERWDKDMRSGKLLAALTGTLPGYRPDVDRVREALTRTGSIQILDLQLQALLAEERSLHVLISNLKTALGAARCYIIAAKDDTRLSPVGREEAASRLAAINSALDDGRRTSTDR